MPDKITKKTCSMCRQEKPLDEFHRRIINGVNVAQGYCIPCGAIYTRMWQKRKPDKVRGYEQGRKAKNA